MTAAEILRDPEALRPPRVVVENFGWIQRATLLASREKAGKSTLLSALATAVSSNKPWLGAPVQEGNVLWICLEDHPHDAVRRLATMEAGVERVHLSIPPFDYKDPVGWLSRHVQVLEPSLVIIDTIGNFASEVVQDSNSPDGWTKLFIELLGVVRQTDAAFIIAAHANRATGDYRGSTAIGANVDMILQMKGKKDSNVREFKDNRGRWLVSDFAIRFVDNEYRLVDGNVGLEAQILTYVGTNPGCSQRNVRAGVSGGDAAIRDEIHRLLRERKIEDQGGDANNTCAYYLTRGDDHE